MNYKTAQPTRQGVGSHSVCLQGTENKTYYKKNPPQRNINLNEMV